MDEISAQEMVDMASDYRTLVASQRSLLLSTANLDMVPEISYAPYVRDRDGTFYIYVSQLARHTVNLLENPRAAILFIHPESESRNLFARERAVFRCRVSELAREDAAYRRQVDALQEKFGEVVGTLRTLPDFHLFGLHPESAQYVVGFGRAFTIILSDDTLMHITNENKGKS